MNKYEIMSLMMRGENQRIHADLYSIAALLAEQLAKVSDKLSAQEIDRFIQIGGAVYHAGVNEFGAAVPVEDLFPAEENWPEGPCPERGGFRKRN